MTLFAEKLLPHNVEAEEAVIGSIIVDGECVARLAPMLKPESTDGRREGWQIGMREPTREKALAPLGPM